MTKRFAIATIMIAAFCCAAVAQTKQKSLARAPNDNSRMSEMLDEFFTRSSVYGFSGSVIVAKGDQVLIRKGYGLIDRKRNLPVTPKTVFSIASLDKQFISAAILKLEEAGKLKVSDPITKFFDFVPEDKRAVTVHQLLSQTSGIPDDYWDEHKELSRAEYVRYVLNNVKLSSQPGSTWEYTNAGFIILEEIVARAAGRPYEQFIDETIFRVAGLGSTGFPSRKWNPDTVAKYRLWTMDIDKFYVDATDVLSRPRPLWVMLSTVEDLYKWYLALKGNKILSAESKKKLFTPVLLDYSYGWNIVQTSRGTKLIHHGGSGTGIGMNATFRWFADEDVFVGILSNSTNTTISSDYFMGDVEAILFGGSLNLPPASKYFSPIPKDLVGKYEFPNGTSFDVLLALGNRLVIRSLDPRAVTMVRFPESFAPPELVPQDTRANEILRGAGQGDFEPLRRFVTKAEDFEKQKTRLQRFLTQFVTLGKIQQVTTIHQKWFNPESEPEIQSFIKLQFEKGQAVVRFTNLPNGEFGVRRINLDGIESLLVPSKDNEYMTWDFTLNTSAKISFLEGKLTIKSRFGTALATRVSEK